MKLTEYTSMQNYSDDKFNQPHFSLQSSFDNWIFSSDWLGQCFGGVETYEKTAGVSFSVTENVQGLVSQPGTAVTRDCAALCRQTANCAAFTVGQSNTLHKLFHVNTTHANN